MKKLSMPNNEIVSHDDEYPVKKKRKIDSNIINSFKCPITRDIFVDPYILVDTGITYEYTSIKRWLEDNNTCPLSNTTLRTKKMTKNKVLESLINEYIDQKMIDSFDYEQWKKNKVLSKFQSMIHQWRFIPQDYLIQFIKENESFIDKQEHLIMTLSIQFGYEDLISYIFNNWNLDLTKEQTIIVRDRYYYPITLNGSLGDIYLYLATVLGYEEIFQILIKNPTINPNYYNYFSNQTILSVSSWYGDIGIVQTLLEDERLDLQSPLILGQPQWVDALSNCAFHGYSTILDKLLSCQEVDPNQGDIQMSDKIPLVIAIERNNYQIIKRLLECSNINVNIHEHLDGDSMIHYAINYGDYDLFEILLESKKINLNEKNRDNISIIELIYIKNDSSMLRLLMDNIKMERV